MNNKTFRIAVVAFATLGLYSCGNHSQADEHDHDHDHEAEATTTNSTHNENEILFTQEQAQAAGLAVETVQPAPFQQVLKASGEVLSAPGDELRVVATSNGVISLASRTLVQGAAVEKGKALFYLSAQNLVEGDPVEKARIAYETAKKDYERAQALVKEQIISNREFEQIRARYQTAQSAYRGVSQGTGSQGVAVNAPLKGFIKELLVQSGDYVTAGQTLAVVSQNSRLQLRAEVSERYYAQLADIQGANFKLSYLPQEVFQLKELNGRLLSFGKSSSASSYYLPVTFEFDNRGNIVPGSFAEIYLLGHERPQVISIPTTALTEDQGLYYVYLQLDQEGYLKREVALGQNNGKRVEITSGLNPGEVVVVKGAYQVRLAATSGVIPEGHNHNH